ncbi:dioxygenase [Seongchinamella sediminis]|uniref:Dioxygenase n=1 Tax=Seongchinamella sediminis TaxID=2283635 RepID=A0A3L7E1I9_9GAMM|nr:class III extradiol ring-cleavage dioxygenase [Seongchinamella sediminis]RLQ23324.1 dioxygenase [Seongchinamella sediminis]
MPTHETGRQPTLFIPHGGGPCFFMTWDPPGIWDGMAAFLAGIADTLPARPRAILMVSAHWQSGCFEVSAGARPELIYDYHGFPAHTYQLRYPAPGDPALAARVSKLLAGAGAESRLDAARGFDHGTFIPLKLMFPYADIPVVQLSLRRDLDPAAHIAAGQALAALRDDNVLIIGSGMSFHNMSAYNDSEFTAPSLAFDQWLTDTLQASPPQRLQALARWHEAPAAYACHPPGEEEHLLPLMVVAGAAGEDSGRRVYSEDLLTTRVSGFRFG